MKANFWFAAATLVACALAGPAQAGDVFISTGNPDGLMATLSRPPGPGIKTETADDFILTQPTRIDSATFTGLLPLGASLLSVTQVEIEFYHVFPKDSVTPPGTS